MMHRCRLVALGLALTAVTAGCGEVASRSSAAVAPQPDQVVNFNVLYSENCSACHGANGQGGAAVALASPIYQALAGDEVLRNAIANGIAGTAMPPFAQPAGGLLTEAQIAALVRGLRAWANPSALAGERPPAYAADGTGSAARGAAVYQTFCGSCHGPDGKGGTKAGSVVDPSFLALTSDQYLRTVVIVGRPELGAPDWRNDWPGHPMTGAQVSDVVAWLAAQRVRYPGRPYPGAEEDNREP